MDENITIEFNDSITLQHVCFAYPETEKDVIHDVSLKIPKNKSIAFIGSSGSGKTTLVDLILGVLTPDSGEILSDRTNVQQNLPAWHDKLGYIPQTIYLLDDSIKNNIAFGMPEKDIDEDKIWEALREAQLETFVKTLPQGVNTQIGEKGVKLSGGQRQRIGIARTLFHNPEILVMDEATSALDNETEQGVMEAVSDLTGTKTMIIVAHRLTTIVNCDLIYEVSEGSIREVGREEILTQINKNNDGEKK